MHFSPLNNVEAVQLAFLIAIVLIKWFPTEIKLLDLFRLTSFFTTRCSSMPCLLNVLLYRYSRFLLSIIECTLNKLHDCCSAFMTDSLTSCHVEAITSDGSFPVVHQDDELETTVRCLRAVSTHSLVYFTIPSPATFLVLTDYVRSIASVWRHFAQYLPLLLLGCWRWLYQWLTLDKWLFLSVFCRLNVLYVNGSNLSSGVTFSRVRCQFPFRDSRTDWVQLSCYQRRTAEDARIKSEARKRWLGYFGSDGSNAHRFRTSIWQSSGCRGCKQWRGWWRWQRGGR